MRDEPKVDLDHPVYSTKCACDQDKEKGQSFCRDCTLLLPKHLREDLWIPFFVGYEGIYARALHWLRDHNGRMYTNG